MPPRRKEGKKKISDKKDITASYDRRHYMLWIEQQHRLRVITRSKRLFRSMRLQQKTPRAFFSWRRRRKQIWNVNAFKRVSTSSNRVALLLTLLLRAWRKCVFACLDRNFFSAPHTHTRAKKEKVASTANGLAKDGWWDCRSKKRGSRDHQRCCC